MKQKYFLITIDTECDKSSDWSVRYPFTFRNITHGVVDVLQPLFNRFGVKPTYLLSPEIIANDEPASIFKKLQGDFELGTHLHGEYIEPFSNFTTKSTDEFQADYTREIEFAKIENLTLLFEKNFGYRPDSFRAGRFGMGNNTLAILDQLGYKVDSSLYPFSINKTIQFTLNRYYYPIKPYYPFVRKFEQKTKRILEVPLTVSSKFFLNLPAAFGSMISNSQFMTGVAYKLFGKDKVKTFSLRPSSLSEKKMIEIIDEYIAHHCDGENVFINMMFHSNEIAAGCSPYAQTDAEVQRLVERIQKTIEYVQSLNARFITLNEVPKFFKQVEK
ncbi:hypothetical protein K1X84_02355 [bacterium]|nr:hypothetical protein [bacterium]